MSTEGRFSSVIFPRLRVADHDRLDEQARARGHAAGYAEGLRAAAVDDNARVARQDAEHSAVLRHGEARVDRAVQLLLTAALALNKRTVPVLREAEDTLVRTAVDLAEAILGSELSHTRNAARQALARVLDHADHADHAPIHTVRMHPDDLAVLGEEIGTPAGVDFAADPLLARGDAIMEFPDGYLDARISTALARVKASLLGEHQ